MDSVIGNVGPLNQCPRNCQVIRISLCFKSAPSASLRSSAVGSDYQSCTQRLSGAFVFERYSWKPIQPRVDAGYLRATLYLDTVGTRTFEQRFLHAGVIDIQRDFAMWRRCMQITARNRRAAHIGDPIRRLMAAAGEQIIHKAQSARGRHSPRQHILAAHPVLEMSFPLQDQDFVASASQIF